MLLWHYSVYILLCVTTLCRSQDVNSIVDKLEDSLQILCPGVNICRNSSTNSLPTANGDSGKTSSCCKTCYCHDNCKKGTCCFNGTESKINAGDLGNSKIATICRNPANDDDDDIVDLPVTQPYYMVTSPPNNGCVNPLDNGITQPCDDELLYPWGSLFPVFSPKTNYVYINPKCAKCHGLNKDEYEKWQGLVLFRRAPTIKIWKDDVFWILNELISNRKMFNFIIQFYPSGHQNLLESEKCYFQLKNVCRETFQIPSNLNLTSNEIKEACYFGPRSPVTDRKGIRAYYNVYCYICDGESLEFRNCFIDSLSSRVPRESLSTLLDDNFLDLMALSSKENKQVNPTACKENDVTALDGNGGLDANVSLHNECRPVLCPTGQARGEDGHCRHYGQKWFGSNYVVMYQLTTNRPVNVERLKSKATFDAFQNSGICPSTWQIGMLYRIPPLVEGKVDEDLIFELAVICKGEAVKLLSEELNLISENIKQPLVIETVTGTMVFTIALEKYGGFQPGRAPGADFVAKVPKNLPKKLDVRFGIISVYSLVRLNSRAEIGITKLYLCEQVSLFPGEFLLVDDGVSAALIYNGRTYFSGEFFLANEGTAQASVRICLDDSDFKRQQMRQNSAFKKTARDRIILLVVLLALSAIKSM